VIRIDPSHRLHSGAIRSTPSVESINGRSTATVIVVGDRALDHLIQQAGIVALATVPLLTSAGAEATAMLLSETVFRSWHATLGVEDRVLIHHIVLEREVLDRHALES